MLTAAVLLSHATAKCSQSRREETCNQTQDIGPMWLLNSCVNAFREINVKLRALPRIITQAIYLQPL